MALRGDTDLLGYTPDSPGSFKFVSLNSGVLTISDAIAYLEMLPLACPPHQRRWTTLKAIWLARTNIPCTY